MRYLYMFFLLLVTKNGEFTEGFQLSPLGINYICPSDQTVLNCVTNRMFLSWNITTGNYSRLRLISSSETRDITPLSMNHTTFRFVRESREPLNITLFIINATAAVDWQISCIEYLSSTQNNTLETTVRVITMTHINRCLNTSIDMIVVQPSFGQKNVTLRLSLDLEGMQSMIDGLTYGIVFASLFEETILVFPAGNDTSVELIMFYNTEYNLSTFAALCGFESRSHAFSLFYESNVSGLLRPSQNYTESRSSIAITILAISVATSCTITLLTVTCGLVLIKLFRLKSLKDSRSALSNAEPQRPNPQAIPVYESVFPMEFQEENMELNDNIAYGPLPVR